MKLPIDGLFAHHMSFPDALEPTIENLRSWLQGAKALGYKGLVIVPALFDSTKMPTDVVVRAFKDEEMEGVVCGFNPGNSYDPLTQPFSAIFELKRQAGYTVALANAKCGPRLMIGPVHTHHMHMRPKWGTKERAGLLSWIKTLNTLAGELGISLALEPLNGNEDGTPDPFNLIHQAILEYESLFIHWDTGHALERGLGAENLARCAAKVAYLELVPQQRLVCGDPEGLVNFVEYRKVMGTLPESVKCGVEPFDPAVVKQLKLEALCQVSLSGPENLLASITYLRSINVL